MEWDLGRSISDVPVPSNPCKLASLIHCPSLTREGHHERILKIHLYCLEIRVHWAITGGCLKGLWIKRLGTGEISINEVTISQVVDLGAQILHFTLSQGVQDLTLGTSSGLPHSSDYGSLLGGSYLDVPPSSAGTAIRDQNINHLSDLGTNSQRAPQADMAPGLHGNSSPVINVTPLYVQGIDHNVMPGMNTNSGTINQFESFHAGFWMARPFLVNTSPPLVQPLPECLAWWRTQLSHGW